MEHPGGLCKSGNCWFRGIGVGKRDKVKGIKLFKMAARRKSPEAQFVLGVMLMRGTDVLQNCEKGAEYLMRAAMQGYEKSVNRFILRENNGKISACWIDRVRQESAEPPTWKRPKFFLPQLESPNKICTLTSPSLSLSPSSPGSPQPAWGSPQPAVVRLPQV